MINEFYFCVRFLFLLCNPSVTKSGFFNIILTNNFTIYNCKDYTGYSQCTRLSM